MSGAAYDQGVPIGEVRAIHYQVVCTACGRDAFSCPRRSHTGRIDAGKTFRKAGWLCIVDAGIRRQHDYERAILDGNGDWFCPSCAVGKTQPPPRWHR